eukprot:CAMPEP_0201475228 /NCGR_PEP_ID=MMETSP0151_2-20130828/678_1 /ASSEMBLY_ACC=CAM_ASM_000257 /TAXON_ID=200890 /ORGANISM="Paramoeba atlantica, Strain 621/1 / CCAP 1560/9" /LENGTH=136 /DNA_ID=CAMNT_0047855261 /DNA_START=89 /DNA_END=499 /DNA_ORIENTATION=+
MAILEKRSHLSFLFLSVLFSLFLFAQESSTHIIDFESAEIIGYDVSIERECEGEECEKDEEEEGEDYQGKSLDNHPFQDQFIEKIKERMAKNMKDPDYVMRLLAGEEGFRKEDLYFSGKDAFDYATPDEIEELRKK